MPRMTVRAFSELGQAHRWDADFFLALQSVEARYHQLEAQLLATHATADHPKHAAEAEATRLLRHMEVVDLKPIRVLGRDAKQFDTSPVYERIISEYPILSLTLLEANLAPALERIQRQITHDHKYLAHL